eukprot:gene2647-5197_t
MCDHKGIESLMKAKVAKLILLLLLVICPTEGFLTNPKMRSRININPVLVKSAARDVGLLLEQVLDTAEDAFLHFRRGITLVKNDTDMTTSSSEKKPVVIVLGTGWSSHAFSKIIETDMFKVICVSPRPYFIFTPMLASTAVGTVEHRSIVEPMRSSNPLVQYIQGEVIDIFPDKKEITIETSLRGYSTSFPMAYDYLIYGIGSKVTDYGLKAVPEFCNFIKEIDDVIALRKKILQNFETALLPDSTDEEISRLLTFVVIGAGPTGVEFTAELADFVEEKVNKLYPKLKNKVRILLFDAGKNILNVFDAALRDRALEFIRSRGIEVVLNTRVTNIDEQRIYYTSTNDASVTAETVYGLCVWAAGNAPRPLSAKLADKLGGDYAVIFKKTGRLGVDPWLRLRGNAPGVFAMGDCAVTNKTMEGLDEMIGEGPLPQTAQVASQQGVYIAHLLNRGYNLTATHPSLGEGALFKDPLAVLRVRGAVDAAPFSFLNFGILAYIGGDEAVAEVKLGNQELFKAVGEKAFLLWRSVYLVKQVSTRTRVLVLFDFIKTKVFGRDLTSL